MSHGTENDDEGRVQGRNAGLQRVVVTRFKLITSAAMVGGLAISLAITFSASVGKQFEYALLGESYGVFLLLGGLLVLLTWWRYRVAVRRPLGEPTRATGEPDATSTGLGRWYSRGSLGASTDWEKPSVAGEDDQDPNRPAR